MVRFGTVEAEDVRIVVLEIGQSPGKRRLGRAARIGRGRRVEQAGERPRKSTTIGEARDFGVRG